jgi:hypothetical protein
MSVTRNAMVINRRGFLKSTALVAGAAAIGNWPAIAGEKEPVVLYRWFRLIPSPREIWVVPTIDDVEEGMILESAAGLAALGVFQKNWNVLIYEDVQNAGYQRWFAEYCRANSPRLVRMDMDEAVSRLLQADVVRGYCLYRFDPSGEDPNQSVNVATSLAPGSKTLLVSERLAGRIEKLGLKQLLDVRNRSEDWCLSQREFSRQAIGTANPKARNARSLMIALNAFVCSGQGGVYEQALARCDEDSPVLGHGSGDEFKLTGTSSQWGLFQTSTDWCSNLPVFASDVIGKSVPVERLAMRNPLHWSALDWGDGSHYVNFTMSDGDNVQWVMGNFTDGDEAVSYYGNPKRGTIPFTWGLPVASLCQLSPRTLAEILNKATPNDDFIQFNGAGYFYPDLYGKARNTPRALELQAERLRAYMELTGIRILAFNFQDWDGADARAACEIFAAKLPGLLGILAFQYYPYSAGNGAIRWAAGIDGDEVPIVSCRFTIWANQGRPHDNTPTAIAAQLNELSAAGERTADDSFSWVIVHAWSRFRHIQKNAPPDGEENGVAQDKAEPDTARGYEPVSWAVERLAPHVKPVTAQELLLRVRLRLRPQITLSRYLAEVEARAGRRSPGFSVKINEARALIPQTSENTMVARHCFELLKALQADIES